MEDDGFDIVRQRAEEALLKLNAQGLVTPGEVAESVLRQATYWEKPIQGDEKLLFVRLYSPVVQREEVFLGHILFNAFLGNALLRSIIAPGFGSAELVSNDLESYYFLIRTSTEPRQIADSLSAELEHSLPDLFFGEQDEERGVYGSLSRMFNFRKSDFEPFPVYAIPQPLAPQLEMAVRSELHRLLTPEVFPGRTRTVLAAIAFFYGRTSGGSGDAQSFPNFADHLVNDASYDGLLTTEEVKAAFNIAMATKPEIKRSLDEDLFSKERVRHLMSGLLRAFQDSIGSNSTKWLLGFLHKDEKFVKLSAPEYVAQLLSPVQVGYHLLSSPTPSDSVTCRICTAAQALVEDRYVTMGVNAFRFDNQRVKGQAQKACARCALGSYLAQKLLGTEMVSTGGKLPQLPKTYNLIFHYGRHSVDAIHKLAQGLDLTWNLVRQHRDKDQIRREAATRLREAQKRYDQEDNDRKKGALEMDLSQKQREMHAARAAVSKVEDDILKACPWLAAMGASPIPAENCSLDAMANSQISEGAIERHVLGLGLGGYRMILFVLPQIRAPRDAKEHDFAQRRFSNSRVTVTTVLSFLRELCGCDGPFYYQSLPSLTPDAFRRDTFYIRNQPISVQRAQDEYEAVTQLAWRLVWQRGSDGFVRKVVLAEKLLEDPLGTFASVMRDSPILGQKKGGYKRLAGDYRPDWKARDLTEYARFIRRLSKIQEVK